MFGNIIYIHLNTRFMIFNAVQQIDETNEIDQYFNIIRHTYKTTCLMICRLFTQWDLI